MADKTSTTEYRVQLKLSAVRQDLEQMKTAWRLAGKDIVSDLRKTALGLGSTTQMMMKNIRTMSERAQNGMAGVIKFEKEFKDMQTLFINLAKSDTTNKKYRETLKLLDDLVSRSKDYHDRSKKLAETKKKNAEAEKQQLKEAAEAEKNSWEIGRAHV